MDVSALLGVMMVIILQGSRRIMSLMTESCRSDVQLCITHDWIIQADSSLNLSALSQLTLSPPHSALTLPVAVPHQSRFATMVYDSSLTGLGQACHPDGLSQSASPQ
eukprot:superscaffoldBa00000344_g3957